GCGAANLPWSGRALPPGFGPRFPPQTPPLLATPAKAAAALPAPREISEDRNGKCPPARTAGPAASLRKPLLPPLPSPCPGARRRAAAPPHPRSGPAFLALER